MKVLRNKMIKSLIIIPVIIIVMFNVFIPTKVYATKSSEGMLWNFGGYVKGAITQGILGLDYDLEGNWSWDAAPGNLIKEIMYMLCGIGDVIESLLQVVMIGDSDFWLSTTISNRNDNLENTDSWLYADQSDVDALQNGNTTDRGSVLVAINEKGLSGGILGNWEVPNMMYSPEMIFSNQVAALDANFIHPNEYNAVTDTDEGKREAISLAKTVGPTIANWYRAFRNLSIVGLLTVLVYIGIRIVIGSTAGEKAKYKERIQDWFVALCLVFFMHFIMAAIMTFSDKLVSLFNESVNSGIIVIVDDGTIFKTNFTGLVRFFAQSASWKMAFGYGVMFLMIIGITVRYTWIYLRRFFFLAFFTMIAPAIALTYPLDKINDGKAQAYNKWFKEYVVLALTQPMHLILYISLIGSATTLCVQNPIYGIAVMIFISTAEKWIKNLFRMDEAKLTATTLGDVAMLQAIGNIGKRVVGAAGAGILSVTKRVVTAGATVLTGGAAAATMGGPAASGLYKAGAASAPGIIGAMKGTVTSGETGLMEAANASKTTSGSEISGDVKETLADRSYSTEKIIQMEPGAGTPGTLGTSVTGEVPATPKTPDLIPTDFNAGLNTEGYKDKDTLYGGNNELYDGNGFTNFDMLQSEYVTPYPDEATYNQYIKDRLISANTSQNESYGETQMKSQNETQEKTQERTQEKLQNNMDNRIETQNFDELQTNLDEYSVESIPYENLSEDSKQNLDQVIQQSTQHNSNQTTQQNDVQDSQNNQTNSKSEVVNESSTAGAGASATSNPPDGQNNTQNNTQNNQELSSMIAKAVADAMSSTQSRKEKENEEKEKSKQEKINFVNSQMADSTGSRIAQRLVKGVTSASGALVGGALGLAFGAIRGDDMGKATILGALHGGEIGNTFASENLDAGLQVMRDKKRKNLEMLAELAPEDIEDEDKAKMMSKVSGMGARNNWDEDRVMLAYAGATSYPDMATNTDSVNRLEQYMRDNEQQFSRMGISIESLIERTKKDIIQAQKKPRRITGRR